MTLDLIIDSDGLTASDVCWQRREVYHVWNYPMRFRDGASSSDDNSDRGILAGTERTLLFALLMTRPCTVTTVTSSPFSESYLVGFK